MTFALFNAFAYFLPLAYALTLLQPTPTAFLRTGVPQAQNTHMPGAAVAGKDLEENLLWGRQVTFSDSTCGYISGDTASPITCPTQYVCGYYPSAPPNFRCCLSSSISCNYISTCLNNGASGNSRTAAGLLIYGDENGNEYLCGTAAPYCTTILLYASTGGQSFLSYQCGTGSETTVTGYQKITAFSISSSSVSSTTSPLPDTTSPPANTSLSPVKTAGAGGLSTGAEAGIGVGVGVGVGGILLGLLLYLFLRRRDRRKTQSPQHILYSAPLREVGRTGSTQERSYPDQGFYEAPKYGQLSATSPRELAGYQPPELSSTYQPAELPGMQSSR